MRRIRLTAALGLLLLLSSLPLFLSRHAQAQGLSSGLYAVPYTACSSTVSGNSTGTNGFTTAGSSLTPVDQASTSVTGTNTQTFICDITPNSGVVSGVGRSITAATFYYGNVNQLGTQAATLASGTMNSSIVFSKILFPTPATSETPSTLVPVRADSGTLVITPIVASFNVTTTAAGQFNTVKFTPATPFAIADLTKYYLTVTLQALATTATVVNTPGVIVYTN